jgi:integrase
MAIKKNQGKWVVDVRPEGVSGKRVRRSFDTKAEAMRFEGFIRGKAAEGKEWNPSPKDKRKLLELINIWYEAHGAGLKDGVRRKDALVRLAKSLSNPVAYKLTADEYLRYRASRIASGISAKTANNELSYLQAVFNELERTDIIDFSCPIKKVRPIKINERELSFLTLDEVAELLTKIESFSLNPHVLLVTKISLATGARWSEAEGITLDKIVKNTITFTDTKSGRNRSVPIDEGLCQEVKVHLKEHSSFGTSTISAFRRALKQTSIDLPKGQAAHVLRHTFASHFVMNGGDILTLQRILGHSSLNMTMRYAHLAPEHLEMAVRINPLAKLNE